MEKRKYAAITQLSEQGIQELAAAKAFWRQHATDAGCVVAPEEKQHLWVTVDWGPDLGTVFLVEGFVEVPPELAKKWDDALQEEVS